MITRLKHWLIAAMFLLVAGGSLYVMQQLANQQLVGSNATATVTTWQGTHSKLATLKELDRTARHNKVSVVMLQITYTNQTPHLSTLTLGKSSTQITSVSRWQHPKHLTLNQASATELATTYYFAGTNARINSVMKTMGRLGFHVSRTHLNVLDALSQSEVVLVIAAMLIALFALLGLIYIFERLQTGRNYAIARLNGLSHGQYVRLNGRKGLRRVSLIAGISSAVVVLFGFSWYHLAAVGLFLPSCLLVCSLLRLALAFWL